MTDKEFEQFVADAVAATVLRMEIALNLGHLAAMTDTDSNPFADDIGGEMFESGRLIGGQREN